MEININYSNINLSTLNFDIYLLKISSEVPDKNFQNLWNLILLKNIYHTQNLKVIHIETLNLHIKKYNQAMVRDYSILIKSKLMVNNFNDFKIYALENANRHYELQRNSDFEIIFNLQDGIKKFEYKYISRDVILLFKPRSLILYELVVSKVDQYSLKSKVTVEVVDEIFRYLYNGGYLFNFFNKTLEFVLQTYELALELKIAILEKELLKIIKIKMWQEKIFTDVFNFALANDANNMKNLMNHFKKNILLIKNYTVNDHVTLKFLDGESNVNRLLLYFSSPHYCDMISNSPQIRQVFINSNCLNKNIQNYFEDILANKVFNDIKNVADYIYYSQVLTVNNAYVESLNKCISSQLSPGNIFYTLQYCNEKNLSNALNSCQSYFFNNLNSLIDHPNFKPCLQDLNKINKLHNLMDSVVSQYLINPYIIKNKNLLREIILDNFIMPQQNPRSSINDYNNQMIETIKKLIDNKVIHNLITLKALMKSLPKEFSIDVDNYIIILNKLDNASSSIYKNYFNSTFSCNNKSITLLNTKFLNDSRALELNKDENIVTKIEKNDICEICTISTKEFSQSGIYYLHLKFKKFDSIKSREYGIGISQEDKNKQITGFSELKVKKNNTNFAIIPDLLYHLIFDFIEKKFLICELTNDYYHEEKNLNIQDYKYSIYVVLDQINDSIELFKHNKINVSCEKCVQDNRCSFCSKYICEKCLFMCKCKICLACQSCSEKNFVDKCIQCDSFLCNNRHDCKYCLYCKKEQYCRECYHTCYLKCSVCIINKLDEIQICEKCHILICNSCKKECNCGKNLCESCLDLECGFCEEKEKLNKNEICERCNLNYVDCHLLHKYENSKIVNNILRDEIVIHDLQIEYFIKINDFCDFIYIESLDIFIIQPYNGPLQALKLSNYNGNNSQEILKTLSDNTQGVCSLLYIDDKYLVKAQGSNLSINRILRDYTIEVIQNIPYDDISSILYLQNRKLIVISHRNIISFIEIETFQEKSKIELPDKTMIDDLKNTDNENFIILNTLNMGLILIDLEQEGYHMSRNEGKYFTGGSITKFYSDNNKEMFMLLNGFIFEIDEQKKKINFNSSLFKEIKYAKDMKIYGYNRDKILLYLYEGNLVLYDLIKKNEIKSKELFHEFGIQGKLIIINKLNCVAVTSSDKCLIKLIYF